MRIILLLTSFGSYIQSQIGSGFSHWPRNFCKVCEVQKSLGCILLGALNVMYKALVRRNYKNYNPVTLSILK